jgi:hypothetical protein
VAFKSPDALAADNTYTWPNAYPGADDWVLTSTAAGIMSWQDPQTLIEGWFLTGNSNALAASFIGPLNDNIPMNIATSAAVPGPIRMYIGGVAPANLRVELTNTTLTIGDATNNVNTTVNGTLTSTGNTTLASAASSNVTMLNAATPGSVLINGTAGTSNVQLGSLGGAAKTALPGGYDRLVISNATGDLDQIDAQDLVETYAWSLTGNAGTDPSTNFLGTTDGQGLSIRTNSTEAIRVNTSQQVGIGTSTPSQLLEVEDGNILISTSASGTVGDLRWEESGSNGNNYVAFRADTLLNANYTYTLPDTVGPAGYVLSIASTPAPTATTAQMQWVPVVAAPSVETFNVTADNQAIGQAGTTTFLRLVSDGVANARTVTLANGTTQGHVMVIRAIGNGSAAYGVELQDGGNLQLSGNFNMNDGDTMTLVWDGGTWYETSRRNN